MGRPRSSNYEKNLQYRKDAKGVMDREVLANYTPEKRLVSLAKSVFANLNVSKYNREPIYNHEQINLMNDGILLRPIWRIPFEDLRKASYTTSLIGAVHGLDVNLTAPYSQARYYNSDDQGFGFSMVDEKEKTDDYLTNLIWYAVNFFRLMGDKVEGWNRRDRMKSVMEMMTRDTLAIDQISFHLIKNRFGKLIEIKYLDPATIFEIDRDKGYRGNKNVAHVQVVDNAVVYEFEEDEVVLRRKHFSSDIYNRQTGYSPTEACISDLVGLLNALKFNKDRFTGRNPPLGFFSVNADLTQDVIEDLQIQFDNIYTGNNNNYRMPIMGTSAGDIKYQSLNLPSDAVFDRLMQWFASLVLAAHQVSEAEIGIKLNQSQSLSEPNVNEKIKHSEYRRLKSHLSFFTDVFDDIKEHCPEHFNKIQFTFYGMNEKDRKLESDLDKQEISTFKMIDELRIEKDLPTLGDKFAEIYKLTDAEKEKIKYLGAYISDTNLTQIYTGSLGNLQPQEEDGGENDLGDLSDFAKSDIKKNFS